MHRRRGVPYNERVADAFGRIIIHSCGSFEHNLRLLAGTRGLLGVNFGVSECDPRQVADQFGQRAVLLVHGTPVSCRSLPLLDPTAYVDFIFDFIRERDLRAIVTAGGGGAGDGPAGLCRTQPHGSAPRHVVVIG